MRPLQAAAAPNPSNSPAPERLWKAFPLDPTVTPGAQPPVAASPPARAQSDRAPVAASHPDSGGGALMVGTLVLLALLAAAAVTVLEIRRRRLPEPPAAPVLAGSQLVSSGPAPPLWRDTAGRFTKANPTPSRPELVLASESSPGDPSPGDSRRGDELPAPVSPPDRTRAWTAEIEWRQSDAEGVFRVVAHLTRGRGQAMIAESARLEWPPKGPTSAEALRQAVEQLEVPLLAAGWEPLPRGGRWYAKRFAWAAQQPAEAPASAQLPASAEPQEARRPQPSGRFEPRPPWPADTMSLWRCEIKWDAGYINSRFKALAFSPGNERGSTISESATFKWMIMEPPNRNERATRVEVQRLASALVAAGWQRLGHGRAWYSERFVWPHDDPPPDRIELAPVGEKRAS